MGRFVRRSLVTNAFLCLAFKLCDGSQSILHDHQRADCTHYGRPSILLLYHSNPSVGEAWQPRPRRGMRASQKAKARHVMFTSSAATYAHRSSSFHHFVFGRDMQQYYRPDVRSRPRISFVCFCLIIAKMRQFCSEK